MRIFETYHDYQKALDEEADHAWTQSYGIKGIGRTLGDRWIDLPSFTGGSQSAVASVGSPSAVASAGDAEARCRSEWNRNPALRAEFGDSFERYVAYMKAETAGKAHIFATKKKEA